MEDQNHLQDVIAKTRRRALASRLEHNRTQIVSSVAAVVSLALLLGALGVIAERQAYYRGEQPSTAVLATGIIALLAFSVFLIQMLQTTARYHLRMANRLEDMADALELFPGATPKDLAIAIGALSSVSISFGRMPALSGKVFDQLTEGDKG